MTRNCQAQCCTGDPSSDICRDDVARSYTKEGVSRHVVTPGHDNLIYPRSLALSSDGELCLPTISQRASGLLPKDAEQCLYNISHRQYRPQSQFNDNEGVLPWYSYLPPPAPLFHWRRSGPKHCNRLWI